MTKKISLIMAIIISLFGVVLVSTLGLMPENLRQRILIESLEVNVDETTSSGTKKIETNFKSNNCVFNVYELISYLPRDATNPSFSYSVNVPKEKVSVSPSTGIVTVYDFSIQSFIVTVTANDGSNKSVDLIFMRSSNDDHNFDGYDFG